jgi:hypothetical protein
MISSDAQLFDVILGLKEFNCFLLGLTLVAIP